MLWSFNVPSTNCHQGASQAMLEHVTQVLVGQSLEFQGSICVRDRTGFRVIKGRTSRWLNTSSRVGGKMPAYGLAAEPARQKSRINSTLFEQSLTVHFNSNKGPVGFIYTIRNS